MQNVLAKHFNGRTIKFKNELYGCRIISTILNKKGYTEDEWNILKADVEPYLHLHCQKVGDDFGIMVTA